MPIQSWKKQFVVVVVVFEGDFSKKKEEFYSGLLKELKFAMILIEEQGSVSQGSCALYLTVHWPLLYLFS